MAVVVIYNHHNNTCNNISNESFKVRSVHDTKKEETIMAKENVEKFYEEIMKNRDLQEKLMEVQKNYSGEKENRDALVKELLIPFAKENGYEFTEEEVLAADKEIAMKCGEVSEDELENVSGGFSVCLVGGGANGYGSCFIAGYAEEGDGKVSLGLGLNICFYSGIGFNVTAGEFDNNELNKKARDACFFNGIQF